MNNKKLLFVEDLYDFYLNKYKRSTHFSAEKTGHQIFVQVPAQFEVTETEYKDDTLLFCKVKLMHSGENRNHSCVTDNALIKASKNLAYKPVLANFMEYTDEKTGEVLKDFTAHDMEYNKDGSINYIEKQIGCFTSDEPYFEVEEETSHNFLYGYCAIPKEYTDACSIIERKGGTKISVELAINEMSFNAKSKVLELTDVVIMGATCLGKDPDTLEDIGEGMLNARLDIADFSEKNSLFADYDSTIIELQERLTKLESACFNINNNQRKEEQFVETNEILEEVTEEVTETTEDVVDEVADEVTDESTEEVAVTEEMTEETTEDTPEVVVEETDEVDETSEEEAPEIKEDEACGGAGSKTKKKKNNSVEYSYEVDGETRKFEVSLLDKIYAIQDLVNATYAEADNTYYSVTVFEKHVVMCDWWSGKYFKQTYTSENDSYSLTGDRVEVFAEFVTADEQKELDSMRSNYSELKEFKETTEKNKLHAEREVILANEKYSSLSDNEEFKKLVENMDNYSLDELEKEAKIIFADNVNIETFAAKDTNRSNIVTFANVYKSKKDSRYGNLFSK